MASKEDLSAYFTEIDKDKNGSLSLCELTAALKKKGYQEDVIKDLFNEADVSGDKKVTEEEFLGIMGHGPPGFHKAATIRRCFLQFDKDGDGTIDCCEMTKVFEELGRSLSEKDIKRMIEIHDADKSGRLDYNEFIQALFNTDAQTSK